MSAPISIPELVRLLSMSARDVCVQLFPKGQFGRTRMMVGSLAGEPGRSMSVHLVGAKPGNWEDFATQERGDILDLVSHALFAGDKRQAVLWSQDFLGLADVDPAKLDIRRRKAEQKLKRAEADAEKDRERSRASAWRRWGDQATAEIAGTPVDLYLRGRGIDIRRLASHGALRYHGELLYKEHGDPASGTFYPAMVACICGPDGKFMACHRTYLEEDGTGGFVKADVEKPKKVLGPARGGHVSLAKGAAGVSLRRAPEGDACIITEGIENGLTMALACPDMRVIAAYSLGNMASVAIPATVGRRVMVPDNDEGERERAAFQKAVDEHCRQCGDVRVARIPGAKDANDLLMGVSA